jgi:hypothetical protein
MQQWIPILGTIVAMATPAGCRDEQRSTPVRPGQKSYDTSPIDVTAFPEDAAVRQRVLYMPFGEAAARLGSLAFEARSSFVFSRGVEEYAQNDFYSVVQDSRGNFRVVLDTPDRGVEVFLVGEDIYVRQDKGHLRNKPRRGVDTESWTELAFSSMHQILELFRPRLTLVDPRPEKVDGRQAVRYTVALADAARGLDWQEEESARNRLPVSPPARWRELARPLDAKGTLSLDSATGVVTRLSLDGRIEIADREVRPTQLELHFEAAITRVGRVAAIERPQSVPEYRRPERPRDMLSFFADQLPQKPEAKASKPPPATTRPAPEKPNADAPSIESTKPGTGGSSGDTP